jgi:restriction system protein
METFSELLIPLLVLAFLVVTVVLRSARPKGLVGELKVQAITDRRLDRKTYRSLHNLTLPTRDGTTQIDHVVVSKFGVFVIETKNFTGWIFGEERSRKWTQSIYGKKYQFQNPLYQNYKHLKAVEDLLQLEPQCIHSVVVFVGSSEFKTVMPSNVVERKELLPYLRSKTDVRLSDGEVEDSIRTLERSQVSRSGTRRKHIQNLKQNQRNPICPRCGKAMVLRTAKKGPNAGGQFWGCSGFPRCRAIKDAD